MDIAKIQTTLHKTLVSSRPEPFLIVKEAGLQTNIHVTMDAKISDLSNKNFVKHLYLNARYLAILHKKLTKY